MLSDAQLLDRYADQKSNDAFAELVARHFDLVFSAALRQVNGDAHRAQDVAQVVFTALARKAATLRRHPVLVGWLYTAARRVAARAIRTEARRGAREEQAYHMSHSSEPSSPAETTTADWEQLRPLLDEAMQRLAPHERDAVLLRFFARRPFAEIGVMLRVSEDAARMRVERALTKLRGVLASRGITSTSAALALALETQGVMAAPAGLAALTASAALSGAAVPVALGGKLVAAFTFMSTAKTVTTLSVVLACAGIGYGVYERREQRAADEIRMAAEKDRDLLAMKLRAAEARATAEGRAKANTAASAAAHTGPAVATPSPVAGDADAGKAMLARSLALSDSVDQQLASNPEYLEAVVASVRGGYALRFSPLYRMLQLSPDQIRRFEERLTTAQHEQLEFSAAAESKGISPTDPSLAALRAKQRVDFDVALREILGANGLAEYQRYERMYGAREWLNKLANNLAVVGTPLTAPQTDQLVEFMARSSPSFQSGRAMRPQLSDVGWDEVLARAPSFLLPAQFEVLRTAADGARASKRMQELTEQLVREHQAQAKAALSKSAPGN